MRTIWRQQATILREKTEAKPWNLHRGHIQLLVWNHFLMALWNHTMKESSYISSNSKALVFSSLPSTYDKFNNTHLSFLSLGTTATWTSSPPLPKLSPEASLQSRVNEVVCFSRALWRSAKDKHHSLFRQTEMPLPPVRPTNIVLPSYLNYPAPSCLLGHTAWVPFLEVWVYGSAAAALGLHGILHLKFSPKETLQILRINLGIQRKLLDLWAGILKTTFCKPWILLE